MNRLLLLICFLLFCLESFSQSYSVSGVVVGEKNNSSLIGANVILLKASDSSFVKGAIADMQGRFSISNIPRGEYILKISFIGYSNIFRNIEIADKAIDAGTITLKENLTTLKGVTIQENAPASTEKGDTTEFNA